MKNFANSILVFLKFKDAEKIPAGRMNMIINLARSKNHTWTPATWDSWISRVEVKSWRKTW